MLLLARGLIHTEADDAAAVRVTETRPQSPLAAATIAQSKPSVSSPATESSLLLGRVIDAVSRQAVQEFEIKLQRVNAMTEEPPIARNFQSEDRTFAWRDAPVGNWYVTVTAPEIVHVFDCGPTTAPTVVAVLIIDANLNTYESLDETVNSENNVGEAPYGNGLGSKRQ